jgi:hypothetical protein
MVARLFSYGRRPDSRVAGRAPVLLQEGVWLAAGQIPPQGKAVARAAEAEDAGDRSRLSAVGGFAPVDGGPVVGILADARHFSFAPAMGFVDALEELVAEARPPRIVPFASLLDVKGGQRLRDEPDASTGRPGQRAARLQIREHVFPRTRGLRVFIERLQPFPDDALDLRRHRDVAGALLYIPSLRASAPC